MGVRIAVIDSGVHLTHPHIQFGPRSGIAGGIAIGPDGTLSDEIVDRIGHGTAVTAAIREKVSLAEIFIVKVFHDKLSTNIDVLVQAIDWSVSQAVDFINLSLGTTNTAHAERLQPSIDRARSAGSRVVSAFEDDGVKWLPGSLPGVTGVKLDWEMDRDCYRECGGILFASGYPRPIPNVPQRRNLHGISFAVANVTGLLGRELLGGTLGG